MNFDLVRLGKNNYKMFVKIMRNSLIPDGNVPKLCFSVAQTLFPDFSLTLTEFRRKEWKITWNVCLLSLYRSIAWRKLKPVALYRADRSISTVCICLRQLLSPSPYIISLLSLSISSLSPSRLSLCVGSVKYNASGLRYQSGWFGWSPERSGGDQTVKTTSKKTAKHSQPQSDIFLCLKTQKRYL